MQVDIDEQVLEGFSVAAKHRLEKSTQDFATAVIEEANRLETSQNTGGIEREVTGSMVDDASLLVRKEFAQPRKNGRIVLLRVGAAILSLLVGALFDFAWLKNPAFLLVYVILVAAAVLTITLSIMREP